MLVGSPVAKCLWHNGFVIYTRGAAESGLSVERKLSFYYSSVFIITYVENLQRMLI